MKKLILARIGIAFVILIMAVAACKKETTYISIQPAQPDIPPLGDQELPYHHETWMGQLSDALYLSQITIPGTHYAGADKHTSKRSIRASAITRSGKQYINDTKNMDWSIFTWKTGSLPWARSEGRSTSSDGSSCAFVPLCLYAFLTG
ncbi:MAG: hypothetical protein D4R67_12715 [Bacteroidetes bacterium]|nr:MAG: hypothetical protein D4R67_12715 [Bacteroidota bacterium]